MHKVFVDGRNGTTGLEIVTRLEKRSDIELLALSEEKRKDLNARLGAIAEADLTVLCLPDDAAKEIVAAAKGIEKKIVDASTAHRVSPDFTYGFAELKGQKDKIMKAKRVANPGCHASGFIALVAPLVQEGVISPDLKLTCNSLTGYTGGGKKMIAEYEADPEGKLTAPRPYGFSQAHKHLPEMKALSGLNNAPIFEPIVCSYPRGMLVTVPFFMSDCKMTKAQLEELYQDYYKSQIVAYKPFNEAFMSADRLADTDKMEITVLGNDERVQLIACFDNLGKGASGAAVQNMNLMLGEEEELGLIL